MFGVWHFIIKAISCNYSVGKLSVVQKLAIITCIPKQNKPKQFLQNWGPIIYLNCIYKIAAVCIANRIKTVLNKILIMIK